MTNMAEAQNQEDVNAATEIPVIALEEELDYLRAENARLLTQVVRGRQRCENLMAVFSQGCDTIDGKLAKAGFEHVYQGLCTYL